MKVLHICGACFYKENMGYQENLLPKMHKKLGYETHIVAMAQISSDDGTFKYAEYDYINDVGIPVHIIKYKKFQLNLLNRLAVILKVYDDLYKKIDEISPDIIFVHGGQFYSIRDVREYVKENKNVKLFIDQHMDYYNEPKNSKLMKLVNMFFGFELRKISGVVQKFWGTTPWRCQYLKDVYKLPQEKIGLLVMGGDDEKIPFNEASNIRNKVRESLNIEKDDFVLITGGRIDITKNIHLLMDAVIRINNPKLKLIIFGNTFDDVKKYIEAGSKHKSIRYIGWIPSEDSYKYFLSSDLVAFPGTHSVLWEQACACGVPGVFNDWGGMHHVDLGGNCQFIDGNDIEAMKSVINDIVSNHIKYEKMKKIAQDMGIPQFSYLNIAKKAIGIEGEQEHY